MANDDCGPELEKTSVETKKLSTIWRKEIRARLSMLWWSIQCWLPIAGLFVHPVAPLLCSVFIVLYPAPLLGFEEVRPRTRAIMSIASAFVLMLSASLGVLVTTMWMGNRLGVQKPWGVLPCAIAVAGLWAAVWKVPLPIKTRFT